MRLQIAASNLVILSILLLNFKHLSGSKKLNAKIFYGIMLTTFVMVILENMIYLFSDHLVLSQYVENIRVLFYAFVPLYPLLSLLYAETWMYGNSSFSRRMLMGVGTPFVFNLFNILFWYLSQIEIHPNNILTTHFGILYLLAAFFPLVFTWVKMILQRKNYDARSIYELFIISIPVALGGTLQVLDPSLPSFWTGAIISQLIAYFYLLSGYATKDALTQVGNRRALSLDEKQFMQSSKAFIGGILIDVDRFKQINDNHGHALGDEVLKEVANLLQRSVFVRDGVYRLGGDEFLVLLNLEDPKDIHHISSRIEENLSYLNHSKDYPFTLSLSLGMDVQVLKSIHSIHDFIEHLDVRMYETKKEHHEALEAV